MRKRIRSSAIVFFSWACACAADAPDLPGADTDAASNGPGSDSGASGSDPGTRSDAGGGLGRDSGGSSGSSSSGGSSSGGSSSGGSSSGGSSSGGSSSGGSSSGGFTHFFGGFMIDSPASADDAASDGIQYHLPYGPGPSAGDPLYTALQSHNMRVISGKTLNYIEGSTSGAQSYLQSVANNPMIAAFWVLDDWNGAPGGAKQNLIELNKLIHQITPGKPSICGFGGGVDTTSGRFNWDDSSADNFSPEGCDMIALYPYGEAGGSASNYDWTMPKFLAAAFASFKKRGWDQTKTPLVGVPQAFGGQEQGGNDWVVPDTAAVETQTKAFCQQGAIGIIFYAWDGTPIVAGNNQGIRDGVRKGVADCKAIWGVP